jgi:hypothetical protein
MSNHSRNGYLGVAVFIIAVGVACNISTLIPNILGSSTAPEPSTETAAPFIAETGGPPGFSASLLAPDVVKLTWETASDATGYEVQRIMRGHENVTVASLSGETTSFTDWMSPESSTLTYRLQTITKNGPAGASSLQISTQAHKPNPAKVQAAFVEAAAVTATIGTSGGTIKLTDSKGVAYTLVIPPGALDYDLEITMTPIASIAGWPLDGKYIGGVRLEPEGFQLNEVASLSFSDAIAKNAAMRLVGYAFRGGGDEFHLQSIRAAAAGPVGMRLGNPHLAMPVAQNNPAFSLPITILGSTGAGQASMESATGMVMNHAPTSSADAARQKEVAASDDPLALPQSQVAQNGVLEQILNVGNCDEFTLAADAFQHWDSSAKKAAANGDYEAYDGQRATMMEQMAEKAVETIEKAGEECKKAPQGNVPGSVPCAEKILKGIESGSSPFFQELQQQIIQGTDVNDTGLKARLSNSHANLNKCPHSYRVNDAESSGLTWIKQCVPTMDRAFVVSWKSPDGKGEFGFFPDTWESGRARMRVTLTAYDVKTTNGGQGVYSVDVIRRDPQGNPLEMSLKIDARGASTICMLLLGTCESKEDEPMGYAVPIIVSDTRCQ